MSSNEPLLLIVPARQQLFALNPVGLTRTQDSKSKVKTRHIGELVLERSGVLRRVDAVEPVALLGKSAAGRLLARLTGGWQIEVQFSAPLDRPLAEVSAEIAAYIRAGGDMTSEPDGSDAEIHAHWERKALAVEAAQTYDALFAALELPPLDECLDLF